MPNSTTTLFALFPDVASAESAKQELLSHGFDHHDIQITLYRQLYKQCRLWKLCAHGNG